MVELKNSYTLASILCITLIVVSCATIIHGTKQEFSIASSPTGATVTIDGQNHGKTPVVADLKRKNDHTIKIELEGYQPYEVKVSNKLSGWFWGNLLFGGLIGIIIDAADGAMYKLEPKDISVTLAKAGMSYLYKENNIYVMVTLKPDPSWEKIGSLKKIEGE